MYWQFFQSNIFLLVKVECNIHVSLNFLMLELDRSNKKIDRNAGKC